MPDVFSWDPARKSGRVLSTAVLRKTALSNANINADVVPKNSDTHFATATWP
jgi:hypothetical protein